jgi:hypothetical protein
MDEVKRLHEAWVTASEEQSEAFAKIGVAKLAFYNACLVTDIAWSSFQKAKQSPLPEWFKEIDLRSV